MDVTKIILEDVNGKIIAPKDENALFKSMKYFVDHKNDNVSIMAKQARALIVDRFEQKKLWKALLKEYQSLI
jgi:glycosyltransferase involved in cell wall biosynthesis